MSFLQALVLGVVQGLTEFLPVSSSAHLVLVPWWLGWSFEPEAAFAFDVLVQLGTLVAVIVFFARDLGQLIGAAAVGLWHRRPLGTPQARRAWYLLLATLPAELVTVTLNLASLSPATVAPVV